MMDVYAFWKYDNTFGMLGGEVEGVMGNGLVYIKGFERQYGFNPLKILLGEHGRQTVEDFDALYNEYCVERDKLAETYRTRAKNLVYGER